MTRKDYALIAGALAAVNTPAEVIDALAAALATDNPAFNRSRFTKAAGR